MALQSDVHGLHNGGQARPPHALMAGGGWLALRWSGDLSHVFLAQGAALAAFGLINAGAVARGAWFSPIGWSRPRAARVQRR